MVELPKTLSRSSAKARSPILLEGVRDHKTTFDDMIPGVKGYKLVPVCVDSNTRLLMLEGFHIRNLFYKSLGNMIVRYLNR